MDLPAILDEINDHGFGDTGATRKLSFVQQTIWDIESREPWPFLEAGYVDLTFDGTSSVPTNVPSTFRAVTSLRDTTTGTYLQWLRDDDFEERVGTYNTQSGSPLYYYFSGNAINMWPVPTASTIVRMKYLKTSAEVTSSSAETAILIPKQFHRLIVQGSLYKLYEMEDDPDTAERYLSHYERGINDMRSAVWQRQFTHSDSIQRVDDYC